MPDEGRGAEIGLGWGLVFQPGNSACPVGEPAHLAGMVGAAVGIVVGSVVVVPEGLVVASVVAAGVPVVAAVVVSPVVGVVIVGFDCFVGVVVMRIGGGLCSANCLARLNCCFDSLVDWGWGCCYCCCYVDPTVGCRTVGCCWGCYFVGCSMAGGPIADCC